MGRSFATGYFLPPTLRLPDDNNNKSSKANTKKRTTKAPHAEMDVPANSQVVQKQKNPRPARRTVSDQPTVSSTEEEDEEEDEEVIQEYLLATHDQLRSRNLRGSIFSGISKRW